MNKTFSTLFFVLAALVFPVAVLADDGQGEMGGSDRPMIARPQPALLGSVSAIDGTNLTVTARGQSLTVDASSATIVRVPDTTIQVSDIQVGDSVLVQGSLSGSVVSATRIMDGLSTNAPSDRPRMGDSNEHMFGAPAGDEGSSDSQGSQDERGNQEHGDRPGMFGSTTPMMGDGEQRGPEGDRGQAASSSNPGNHLGWLIGIGNLFFNRHGDQSSSGQGNMAFAVGGRIASVDGTTFTIEAPARENAATSTITVSTNASTTFIVVGSGPSTLSAVTIGAFANVRGTMTSTTTRTIAATRVEIASTSPAVRGPSQADMQQLEEHVQQLGDQNGEGDNGTSTPVQHFFQRVFERFSNFFHF